MLPLASFGDQDVPDSFKDYVSYRLEWNTLLLAPELARKAEITYAPSSTEVVTSVSFPLAGSTVTVSFDPGPSDDPAFVINFGDSEEYLGGEKLYISSSGLLYLVRKSNELFEKRLKLSLSDGTLEEVPQPFYRVDQLCETSTPLRMYDGRCSQGNLIATLPKGATVRVLLMENAKGCPANVVPDNELQDPVNNYLVATPFGLVGWVASSGGDITRPGKPLGCLQFFGD
jgi:hypothetical protein